MSTLSCSPIMASVLNVPQSSGNTSQNLSQHQREPASWLARRLLFRRSSLPFSGKIRPVSSADPATLILERTFQSAFLAALHALCGSLLVLKPTRIRISLAGETISPFFPHHHIFLAQVHLGSNLQACKFRATQAFNSRYGLLSTLQAASSPCFHREPPPHQPLPVTYLSGPLPLLPSHAPKAACIWRQRGIFEPKLTA